MDIGAVSMMLYGWREREEMLRLLEMITGLRMNHNFIRPGGIAADLPDGWQDDLLRVCDIVEEGIARVRRSCSPRTRSGSSAWSASARSPPTQALSLGATGPILRSTGFAVGSAHRQRRTSRTTRSTSTSSTPRTATASTGTASGSTRSRSRSRSSRQCVERMPRGDYRVQDKKVTPPPRARINESMEALIHHFKLFTEGFRVPRGRDLRRGRVPPRRDRLLPRVRRHREADPAAHPRSVVLQPAAMAPMMEDRLVADAVAVISSVDPIMGEVDR